MFVKKFLTQHRNDFTALMRCEHCEATELNGSGYFDDNYFHNVVPRFYCKACHKNRAGVVRLIPDAPT